jgi:osomolarity two-component system response regulator SSK1
MARFINNLRPFFRRVHSSSKRNNSTVSENSTSTTALPSPGPHSQSSKSPSPSTSKSPSSEKSQDADTPERCLAPSTTSDNTPSLSRTTTAPGTLAGDDDNTSQRRPSPSDTLVSFNPDTRLQKVDSDIQLPKPLRLDIDELPQNPRVILEQPTPDAFTADPVE